jgi:hypothetical protein
MSIKETISALVGTAAELQAIGAVRSEHDVKFQALRVGLDQAAAEALAEEEAGKPAPLPDAAAFDTLAALVHLVSDKVDAIGEHLGA